MMMQIRKIATGLVGIAACSGAIAQGSFNFDDIPGVEQQPIVAVDINSVAIGFIRAMTREFDPSTADLLEGLRGIKLRVYHAADEDELFGEFIQDVAGRLERTGWQQVMAVQDVGSNVRIHMQMTEEAVSGMTVMAFDGAEAIFINIDGSINAADLGRVLHGLGMDEVLGSMPAMPPPAGRPAAPNGDH